MSRTPPGNDYSRRTELRSRGASPAPRAPIGSVERYCAIDGAPSDLSCPRTRCAVGGKRECPSIAARCTRLSLAGQERWREARGRGARRRGARRLATRERASACDRAATSVVKRRLQAEASSVWRLQGRRRKAWRRPCCVPEARGGRSLDACVVRRSERRRGPSSRLVAAVHRVTPVAALAVGSQHASASNGASFGSRPIGTRANGCKRTPTHVKRVALESRTRGLARERKTMPAAADEAALENTRRSDLFDGGGAARARRTARVVYSDLSTSTRTIPHRSLGLCGGR